MRLLLAFLFTLFLAGSAEATTYYVATNGLDTNPGTSGSPFLTIQKAANVVNPGDTVIVKDGTYVDTYIDANDAIVRLLRSGSAGNYITFKSENPQGAKLNGQSNTIAHGWMVEAAYIRIEGFEIYGVGHTGVAIWASHVQVVGNNFHDIGRLCTNTTSGLTGIYANGGTDLTIENNIFHDSGRFDATEQGCTLTTYLQQDHGMYFGSVDTVVIKNNIFYNLLRGYMIQFYNGSSQVVSSNVKILNNTMHGTAPHTSGGHIMLASPGVTNAAIENNISYAPKNSYQIAYYLPTGAFTNVVARNNITYQGTIGAASPPAGISFSGNLDNTNPTFVDIGSYNFHLLAGSPAIDAGLTESSVPTDFAGAARPQGAAYDIGAYEYNGTAVPTCTAPFPSGFFCGDYYRSTIPGQFTTLYGNIASEGNATTPFLNYSSFDATLGGATRCGQQNLCAVRWQGNYTFSEGNYTFSVTSDDGFRLYIDDTLVMNHWIDQAATAYTYGQAMTAGVHLIKVEYYENTGAAVAVVGWTMDTPPPPAGPRTQTKGGCAIKGAATIQ